MSDADPKILLRLNPLFSSLEPAAIDGLARLCRMRSLPAGQVLFQRGETGDALYGIRRGQIAIEAGDTSGARITLTLLGAGDLFGEIACLDGKERSADAVAVEATELFALRRADLLAYIGREPSIGIKLIEVVCARLRAMSGQIEQGLMAKLDARLATRLLSLAEDFGAEIEITQEALARHVGATRESVNRQLKAWQKAGFLDVRRSCIEVKNPEGIRAACR